jgi:uncharacterized protein YbjT (DUF2867 family)
VEHRYVLVLGGSGFIGNHLVAKLAWSGRRVIVPTRRYQRSRHLAVLPAVDNVVEADIHDDAVLRRLVHGVDAVINLVGMLHSRPGQPYGPEFAKAHVELPRRVVEACAANGVRRYLHMSALGADANGPSMYLRSKAAGEAAAFSNPALAVTVFRPSVVFGEDDRFLNLFATMQKRLPVIPLAGADARFQPVYVQDVAQAFVNSLDNIRTFGKTYELAGPAVYTLRELVHLSGVYAGYPRPIVPLPASLARFQAWLLEHLPGTPLMSRDNLDSMKRDNIASGPIAAELGITPQRLEAIAPFYLSGRAA